MDRAFEGSPGGGCAAARTEHEEVVEGAAEADARRAHAGLGERLLNVGEEALQRRALKRAAREAAVVVGLADQRPALGPLAGDVGLAGFALAATPSWWLVLLGATAVAAAWTYTGGSRPYGYRGLGEVAVFAFFGVAAVAGTAYVQMDSVTWLVLAACVPVGLLACALLVVNNLRDIPSDLAAGKHTLAVLIGDQRTRVLYGSCLLIPFGMAVLIAALLGVLMATRRNRALLLGLWGGYFVYGLFLPYQMYTHSYYHEQLIPIIALSLIPVTQAIMQRMQQQPLRWQLLVVPVLLAGIIFPAWESIATMKAENDRAEPAYWEKIASYLPTDGKILALTQDYGYRLMYYGWRKVVVWPNRGEIKLSQLRGIPKEFQTYFAKQIQGKSYFLITAFNQYNGQEDLKQMLSDNYPVYAQGNGYLIFDLAHPMTASAPASSP